MSTANSATVKAVLSGDTLVLVGKASTNGPPPEIIITLASLRAPLLSRGARQESPEEAFAWESREFLRKLTIGKPVTFTIIYCVTSIGKTFGDVNLVSADGSAVNVASAVVSAGWSTVFPSREGRDSAIHAELVAAEEQAKAAKRGLHTSNAAARAASVRTVSWNPTAAEVEAIATAKQGARVKAVIEGVKDAGTLRVLLLDSFTYVTLFLAGVNAPRAGSGRPASGGAAVAAAAASAAGGGAESTGDDSEAAPAPAASAASSSSSSSGSEPFGQHARLFAELRLLNRELDVLVLGFDARATALIGTVLHPKGDVAVELVRQGLAKVNERTLSSVSRENALTFRQAEAEARANKRFLWSVEATENSTASRSSPSHPPREMVGTCVEVLSGDTLLVLVDSDSASRKEAVEVKVTLASVKVPRLASKGFGKAAATPVESEALAWESKEWVRGRLIGKRVHVRVEYEKYQSQGSAAPGAEKNLNLKTYSSVRLASAREGGVGVGEGPSVALGLVSEGLATVVKHRREEPRSSEFEALQLAEAEAAVKGKGLHAKKVPASPKINDLTTDGKRAKAFLSVLQPKKPLRGIVDFVYSGSRFKVTIPSEQCTVQFSIAQVRTPLGARPAANGNAARVAEPFSEESKNFARLNLLNRTVEVIIDDSDKNGIALGRIYPLVDNVNWRAKRAQNFSIDLLTAGLARLDKYYTGSDGDSLSELQSAQDRAKAVKLGVWSIEEPEEVEVEAGEDGAGTDKPVVVSAKTWAVGNTVSIKLCDIVNGTRFYAHAVSSGVSQQLSLITDAVTEVAAALGSWRASASAAETSSAISKGQIVAVLFEEGSSSYWCRGIVKEVLPLSAGKADLEAVVFYMDYGNSDVVEVSKLLALDAAVLTSVADVVGTQASLLQLLLSTQPLAQECQLALLQGPPASVDALSDGSLSHLAGCALHELAWDKPLQALVLGIEYPTSERDSKAAAGGKGRPSRGPGVVHCILYEERPETEGDDEVERVSINEKLTEQGLAMLSAQATRVFGPRNARGRRTRLAQPPVLDKNPTTSMLYDKLVAAQRLALREHLSIFRYGEPGDSDDEAPPRAPAAAASSSAAAAAGGAKAK